MDDRDVGFLQMFIFIFERKTFFLMFYLNQRCRFLTKGKLKFDTYDIIVLSWKFFRESQTLSDQCMVYLNIFNPKLPKSWVILDLPVVVKVFTKTRQVEHPVTEAITGVYLGRKPIRTRHSMYVIFLPI